MRQADHRGVVQIQKFCAFLKVYTKAESTGRLIPVAAYAHVRLLEKMNRNLIMLSFGIRYRLILF